MLKNLLEDRREDILKIAARYRAHNVRVYGSVARGDDTPQSDVDLLVDFDPDHSLWDRIGLMQDLEDLLGRKVDVATEKTLHWYIHDRVMNQAVPL